MRMHASLWRSRGLSLAADGQARSPDLLDKRIDLVVKAGKTCGVTAYSLDKTDNAATGAALSFVPFGVDQAAER